MASPQAQNKRLTLTLQSTVKSASTSGVPVASPKANTSGTGNTSTNTHLAILNDIPSSTQDFHNRTNSSSIRKSIPITKSQRTVLMKQAKKESRFQTGEQRRMLSIIKIVTKFTVLVTVDAIFTVIALIIAAFLSTTTSLAIHAIVASMCAIYCFKIYEKEYSKRCKLCHQCAFKLCICYLFKTTRPGESMMDIHRALEQEDINHNDHDHVHDHESHASAMGDSVITNTNTNTNATVTTLTAITESPQAVAGSGGSLAIGDESGDDGDSNNNNNSSDKNEIDSNLELEMTTKSNQGNKIWKIPEPKINTPPVFKIDKNASAVIQRFITLEEAFEIGGDSEIESESDSDHDVAVKIKDGNDNLNEETENKKSRSTGI